MDIHFSENNLGDIDQSSEKVESTQPISNEKNEEMNPYAHTLECIHEVDCDEHNETDNNTIIEEGSEMSGPTNNTTPIHLINAFCLKSYQNQLKQIKQRQIINNRRDDIMRSVAKERFGNLKPKAKQLIKAGVVSKNNSYPRLSNLRRNHISTLTSPGNYIRTQPEINTSVKLPMPIITKKYENFSLRNDPPIPSAKVGPWHSTSIMPSRMSDIFMIQSDDNPSDYIQPMTEKPQEVNLAEIVTSVLQDVLTGKIASIENVIGKLRITYEEKNVFTNIKKRHIMLLNFEDDTMRPVLKIEDKYMDIIQKWYEDCDLLIDIEETNVSIPENITVQDVSGILFQDINYNYKEEYLNNYMPLIINNIISKRSIKDLERKYFVKPANNHSLEKVFKYRSSPALSIIKHDNEDISDSQENTKLKDLGVVIPANINPSFTKELDEPNKTKTAILSPTSVSPWFSSSVGSNDPEILNKYILDNPHNHKSNEVIEIQSYNNTFSSLDDSNIPKSYTDEYDCLHPKFSDNCALVNEIVVEQNTKSKSESIYVLINDKFLQTLTIKNPDQNVMYIIRNHPEFGFIKLFNYATNNADIIHFIEREFDKVSFNDIEEVNKKLLMTSQYIDFSIKQNDANIIASTEENLVKKYLNSKYSITDDITNKMKASTLYDIIINSNAVKIDSDKISGFRTRLSKYLKDLGLQKKRYNDGFYYYGIVEKHPIIYHANVRDGKPTIELSEIMRKRSEESNNFVFVYKETLFTNTPMTTTFDDVV
jgi:hypothetical protein